MKLVFMGTPDFSVPCLEALLNAGHEIAAVFTKPDKPRGRGNKMTFSPVKEAAVSHEIAVYQPNSMKKGDDAEESLRVIREINPDCIVVVAYGQILPKAVLDLPRYGCINVHASLLPRYRGAAPIQWSIIDGESESGVTTMYMAEGVDTGDMILRDRIAITDDMTGTKLHDALSEMGAKLIVETLKQLEAGTAPREVQDDSCSCKAEMLNKELCELDYSMSAIELCRLIKGLADSPCAFTMVNGKRLKVYFAELSGNAADKAPGTVVDGSTLEVACGDGKTLFLKEVMIEGGKRLKTAEFLRGKSVPAGTVLG